MANLTIPEQLADILAQIRRSGSFCASGKLEVHLPRLEIEGVGVVALPLLPMQAKQLIASAEQAPYGKGTETLTDTKVRNTWQIGAEKVRISGRGWQNDLNTIVKQAVAGLGVEGRVTAELYKVLVYETGSFFINHRDSEKAPGMFATLVIVLPSDYRGGELIIRHLGDKVSFDLRCVEPAEVGFATFYADCVHEVRPLTAGYRLTLIYNLIREWRKGEPLPTAPDNAKPQAELTSLLHAWASGNEPPDKIIYPLEHAYTEAEINFATLKGNDAPKGEVLINAAAASNCQALLALLSIAETGYAEYADDRYEDQEFEIGEVMDSDRSLLDFRYPDGTKFNLKSLPFADAEIAPPSALDDAEDADNVEFSEATGNAGASFERLYTRAALVVWPQQRRLAVIAQTGINATIALLGNLLTAWRNDGANRDTMQHKEILQLVTIIQNQWSKQEQHPHRRAAQGDAILFLEHLLELGSLADIDTFLALRTVNDICPQPNNAVLVQCLRCLPTVRSGEILMAIINHNSTQHLAACANLLQSLARGGVCLETLPIALTVLVNTMFNLVQAKTAVFKFSESLSEERIELLTALLPACELITPSLAMQVLDQLFVGQPNAFSILMPVALRLHGKATLRNLPSVRRLRDIVIKGLRDRVAIAPSLPVDWQRDNSLTCVCATCTELAKFLANPAIQVWQYRAAQVKRDHVEGVIKRSHSDLDCAIVKNGSPHTLVCTKNTASYQRLVAQRQTDLQHLATLENP